MRLTLLKQFLPLALAACVPQALADPPALVGRISAVDGQGQVLVRSGADSNAAALNWPVTSDNVITTRRGAGAEFRVGSGAVRLAGDSELEVVELDDDSFKLRLRYGSVGVRLANPDMLSGFALETEQARVLMLEPGQLRVEAGREVGASVVGVVAGAVEVDSATGRFALRAGQRADIRADAVRTAQLRRDAFDDWPDAAAAPAALRYLSDDVTGYEELDRYGSWRDDAEYGPLWLPGALRAGWTPYSDGRWSWIAPWGWTWIDNAPWGYAPSHYGRWVLLRQRWHWAPGRGRERQVWAPALVGWPGGNHTHTKPAGPGAQRPASGWVPLAPHQRYVPGYRTAAEQEWRQEWRRGHRQDGAPDRVDAWRQRDRSSAWHERDRHPGGVTVTPPGRPRNQTLTTAPPDAGAAPAAQLPHRPDWGGQRPWSGRMRTETEPASPATQHPGRERREHERERGQRGAAADTARPQPQQAPPVMRAQPSAPAPAAAARPEQQSREAARERLNDRRSGIKP
ncbi:hypothetical protein ACFDR9_001461 [Janthinobacterium sp. CG_23.3]|uniref:DUF6600 domain-containing protein n=1 Tax=Janthinobacterium sp. CG_23.3 TaxID=3349634 RepID=UPI0038D42829